MKLTTTIIITATLLTVFSCKKDTDSNYTYQLSKVKHSFLATYKHINSQHSNSVQDLISKNLNFSAIPIITNFNLSKDAWKDSYQWFNIIKPLNYMNFESNPISFDVNRVDLSNFDMSYIDYTVSTPSSGIIFDAVTYPVISKANVNLWNLNNSSTNNNQLTLGFHVIEFLLWGEDTNPVSSGSRQHTDFVNSSSTNDRRGVFLRRVSEILRDDLVNNPLGWNTNFENKVLEMDGLQFFQTSLEGMMSFIDDDFIVRTLSKPLTSLNIDDELSRFSDNTNTDIRNKLFAIEYFIDGRELFDTDTEYFLIDFLQEIDDEKATIITKELKSAKDILIEINSSFDVAITNSDASKLQSIKSSLQKISDTFGDYLTILKQ